MWPFRSSRTTSCSTVSDEALCFQGDRGPKGTCGGDGPKGEKVGLLETKCSLVGDEEEVISVNEDAVRVER